MPSNRNETDSACDPFELSRKAPGAFFPVSVLTDEITVPATSVVSFVASRPLSGSSTMRVWSTTSLIVALVTSTVAALPATLMVSLNSPSSSATLTVRFW